MQQQHHNSKTDMQTDHTGEPLPNTRLTKEETREVIRLYMEESGLDAPPDTPTIQDVAEGLGIPPAEVTRLRTVLRERQEEQWRKQQAEAEQHARQAEAEARTAEAKAQLAEAKRRQQAAEARTREALNHAETVRNPIVHPEAQTTRPMTAAGIIFLCMVMAVPILLMMQDSAQRPIRPVPQGEGSPQMGYSQSREVCYGCRQPKDHIESVPFSIPQDELGIPKTAGQSVRPAIPFGVRLCPNCRQPGTQEKYVEEARKRHIAEYRERQRNSGAAGKS